MYLKYIFKFSIEFHCTNQNVSYSYSLVRIIIHCLSIFLQNKKIQALIDDLSRIVFFFYKSLGNIMRKILLLRYYYRPPRTEVICINLKCPTISIIKQ